MLQPPRITLIDLMNSHRAAVCHGPKQMQIRVTWEPNATYVSFTLHKRQPNGTYLPAALPGLPTDQPVRPAWLHTRAWTLGFREWEGR